LSRSVQQSRESKADMIRRMLAGTADTCLPGTDRERMLAINQVMARQVVQRSKLLAGMNTI
jgi:hypothetical protein